MPVQAAVTADLRDEYAERVVLCGCLKEPELVLPRLWDMGLDADDFGFYAHRLVWEAVEELATTGRGEVGPHSLWRLLKASGSLADLGPHPSHWIAGLWDADPTGAWAVPEAHRVLELSLRRRAVHRANELIRDALDGVYAPRIYRERMAELCR